MATWTAFPGRLRSRTSVQAATEADPAAAADGVELVGVSYIVPVARAPAGQTFTGSGTLQAFVWVEPLARWVRAPRADEDLADLAGLAEGALTPLPVTSPVGRLALVFKGAWLSGGAAPELDLVCTNRSGEAV